MLVWWLAKLAAEQVLAADIGVQGTAVRVVLAVAVVAETAALVHPAVPIAQT